ncbi:U32 family peptidase [Luteolibacter sp. LG18]|uniref:U32 family peptidase n=1 Tax=Luteolibacter sp. LG18 TaxID=2819286 RepID=UPI002B2D3735|nr:peptidase U32 [Luteolibacter sp. LG18]
MQPSDSTPELLSPAGNWDCARAAVAAGADAIFFGLPKFNARLRADNFTEDDLPELMKFLHKHGVKGFVTMNTLVFSDELEAAERQLRLIAAAGVDALIIQDLGLAKMAREIAPGVELHASTQMTITSPEGLAFIESLYPMERAVLARELSLKEIERFQAAAEGNPHAPLEVFVHGALCVAYSGQCLTSESLGQRSANRGECAQACRMPYEIVVDGEVRELGEVRYLLSPQDLAAVDVIPGLVKAGVKSFKIEGRLKSPEYVAAVTRVYRKAIDDAIAGVASSVTAEDRYELEMTFSRGLTSGWLAGTNHPYLVHGRFGKKRGPLLGEIARCGPGWVELKDDPAIPLAAGDGVVFDAGEDRNEEQGARIWKIENGCLLFHRSHSGLDFDRIRPGQTLYKTSDPRLESEIRRFWQNAKLQEQKIPLHLVVTGQPGEPLVLSAGKTSVSSTPLEAASKRALSSETLLAQLSRLGDTAYELASLDNRLEGDCHLAVSELNRLRRALVEQLEPQGGAGEAIVPATAVSHRDLLPVVEGGSAAAPKLSVLCRSLAQVDAALDVRVPVIQCDFEDPRRYKDAVAMVRARGADTGSEILLATPRILKPGENGYLKLIERAEADGVLLRNLASLQHFKDRSGLKKVGDFSLNVANPITAKLLKQAANLDLLTVSYDLNISQVLDLLRGAPADWFELTLHQHMPLFHMEHCVFCTFLSKGTSYKDCGRPCEEHVVHLRDRVGQLHRLVADVGCRNTLFNGRAQTGARFFDDLKATGLSRFRIELLDEDKDSAKRTIRAYQALLRGESDSVTLLRHVKALEKLGVTEGTLL